MRASVPLTHYLAPTAGFSTLTKLSQNLQFNFETRLVTHLETFSEYHTTLKSSHTRRALSLPFNILAELARTFNVLI